MSAIGKTDSVQASALAARFRRRTPALGSSFVLDVDFEAPPGFTILFGASGAGKTTLLDCVAGLLPPDLGRIAIGNRALFDASQHTNLPVAKRRVGYVFQTLALFPHLTVEQNVEYGLDSLPQPERRKRAASILDSFHIAHLAQRPAREISGGESQRTALARTLVTDPSVLLLDEPLAALDAATKSKIIDDLRAWNREHRIPILYVTHSREEVFALGERVIVLDSGRIVAQGTPHEVMTAPLQETVAQLAGFENIFDVTVDEIHPERGTMVCRVVAAVAQDALPFADHSDGGKGTPSAAPTAHRDPRASAPEGPALSLETPLVRASLGSPLRVGIRAGDILLATSPPQGLSARNIIGGVLISIELRDMIVSAKINCGIEMDVHLTLAARDSLQLAPGKEVWLVIKTHSCHLMQRSELLSVRLSS